MPEKLNFKEIAQNIDVEAVANLLGLTVKGNRASCPACEDERSIQLYPETNSFFCHSANKGGDVIGFYAHAKNYDGMYRAAKELHEHFSAQRTAPVTAPQKPAARNQPSAPPKKDAAQKGFDKEKFAESLSYDGEVADLSETVAQRHRIGTKRGKLYLPICPPDVEPVCWAELHDGKLRLPDSWLPASNVVTLKRA